MASKLWKELLRGQKIVDLDFAEHHFPLESDEGDDGWEVYVHFFQHGVRGEQALRLLEEQGFRLLEGARRAMEYLVAFPALQNKRPLVISCSWQKSSGCWLVPEFRTSRFGASETRQTVVALRRLTNKEFGPEVGWLVLRKKHA